MWFWIAIFSGFPRFSSVRSVSRVWRFVLLIQIALLENANFPALLHLRAVNGQNGVSAVADVDAALGQAVSAHEGLAAQPERLQLRGELAHGERGNGLGGVEDVADGAQIEAMAVGAEGELAKKKGVGEVGALEMGGAVARNEEKPETRIGDEGERREVDATTPTVNQRNKIGTQWEHNGNTMVNNNHSLTQMEHKWNNNEQ